MLSFAPLFTPEEASLRRRSDQNILHWRLALTIAQHWFTIGVRYGFIYRQIFDWVKSLLMASIWCCRYYQDYNGRGRPQSQTLPDQREWKVGTQMAWIPENSDHPISREPTNRGLAQTKIANWHREKCASASDAGRTDFTTTTKYFFGKVPEQTRVDRFYIGKSLNKQKSTVLPLSSKTLDALATAS